MRKMYNKRPSESMSLSLMILLMVPAFLICGGCSETPTENLVDEALALSKKGGRNNWKEVCRKLEICMKRGVAESNLLSLYILSKDQMGDREQAITLGLRALEQNPDSFMLNYFVGKMYFENKKFRTALHYLGKCHNQHPNHVNTLLLMIYCAENVNLTLAVHLYSQLMSKDTFGSSYLLHNGLGVCYTRLGEFSKAMSSFSKALKLSDGHPQVYLNMAVLSDRHMEKPNIAKQHYMKYLEQCSDKFPEKSKKVGKRLKKINPTL